MPCAQVSRMLLQAPTVFPRSSRLAQARARITAFRVCVASVCRRATLILRWPAAKTQPDSNQLLDDAFMICMSDLRLFSFQPFEFCFAFNTFTSSARDSSPPQSRCSVTKPPPLTETTIILHSIPSGLAGGLSIISPFVYTHIPIPRPLPFPHPREFYHGTALRTGLGWAIV